MEELKIEVDQLREDAKQFTEDLDTINFWVDKNLEICQKNLDLEYDFQRQLV